MSADEGFVDWGIGRMAAETVYRNKGQLINDTSYAYQRGREEHSRNLQLSSKNRHRTASAMPTDRSFPVGHTKRIFGGEAWLGRLAINGGMRGK